MESSYKRLEDIDKKIHSVQLPYNAWKLLFLIDEAIKISKLSELLEMDEAEIRKYIDRLVSENLIEAVDVGKEESEVSEEAKGPAAEPDEDQDNSETELEEQPSDADTSVRESVEPEAATEQEPEIDLDTELAEEEKAEDEFPEEDEPKTAEPEQKRVEETGISEEPEQEEVEEIDIKITSEDDKTADDIADLNVEFTDQITDEPQTEEKEEQPEEPAAPAMPRASAGGRPTILVIDDSIVIRKMVEIALEEENMNIETAVSGKDGLDKIDSINPDLVILDLMLPDINGIDILKTIKASKGLPVIMLSGKDSPQMVENAKNEGADAFLPKPFKDEELVEKIRNLIK